MDTFNINKQNKGKSKGGFNPFPHLLTMGAGTVFGAAALSLIDKWREVKQELETEQQAANEQTAQNNVQETPQVIPHQPKAEEMAAQQQQVSEQPQQQQVSEQPQQQQVSEQDQEVPEELKDQVDSADGEEETLTVGEPHTYYSETGEVSGFEVRLNIEGAEDVEFILADADGDGVYTDLFLADGTPLPTDGSVIGDALARAQLTSEDLQEMHNASGGYLAPDPQAGIAQNGEDPAEAILDEHGEYVAAATPTGRDSNDDLAQNTERDAGEYNDNDEEDDQDELLAQLNDEDDDQEDYKELLKQLNDEDSDGFDDTTPVADIDNEDLVLMDDDTAADITDITDDSTADMADMIM